MQEEVENRTLTLVVNGTKFTERLFKAAICKYLAHRKPYFGHEGGIALWEDSNFFDGDAVLHALELVVQRLIAPQQIIFELGFVASETHQRQTRRNAHRTFGRQAALQDFSCNRCQRQQVVVVVYGLVPLDRLPPGATNKKAPAKL